MARITKWVPEDPSFWENEGKYHARRNLWISITALFLAFAVWQIWSVMATNLNDIGFNYTESELFLLTALPGLTGATLRIIYTFLVPIFGGRNWTVMSTASLLVPAVGIGFAVQNPETPFWIMALLAALCGFGGGNFASSMSNISFFYPKKAKGTALGLNAGIGNLGVSAVQLLSPLVIAFALFGPLSGAPQYLGDGQEVFMQNAAFIWVVPIVLTVVAAFFGMDNLPTMKTSIKEQAVIFKNKHTWIMTWLYTMCFGSFIGYAAAFPLLTRTEFPEVNVLQIAFIGPLLGALIRPLGGWLSDKLSGAFVTFWDIILLIGSTLGVMYFYNSGNFTGFLIMFIIVFIATGIANGSTFRMIPFIFEQKEAAAVIGFTSAIAAYGAFLIPSLFGWSIDVSGMANLALLIFIIYYIVSLALHWYYYARKGAEVKC
ncbi:NarK family nitrate/nitrite MFS transporter [Salipaludibacillus sp. LMS25]|jgi:NNP family nitrate/nitrite transporter-like MFS transporter|uniref:NarK family nitrate/nitrite MFS transporter n=1 Tax=Salipaludibacillus sp. LMS25 TaxID=2924031 RepID=UPI0020D077A4|nr:NarK family nitrate/nitrite MFS transporter [Salipaludibacillus sp. LMS25]UTR15377.1 NarK family nitrate/nitrite MFS transporter [Salipaludibacillus sp. LMS25]